MPAGRAGRALTTKEEKVTTLSDPHHPPMDKPTRIPGRMLLIHKLTATAVIFALLTSIPIDAARRPTHHFGAPCQLCECFVEYTDRDVNFFTAPYKMVNNSYEATEDRCLAMCHNEQRCRLVVYGYVGGREVFACEMYEEVNMKSPLYTPFTNIYIKRGMECRKSALGYEPLETMEVDERVAARKQRYLRLFQKFNFFGFG